MSVVVTDRQPERKRKEKDLKDQGTLMTLFSKKKSVILVKVVGRFLC